MKWLMIVLVLFVGACVPTTAEIQTLTGQINTLMAEVDSTQDLLKETKIVSESELSKANQEIDRVQEDITKVATAIQEKAEQGTLEAAEAGWKASEAWNPYYGYGMLALGFLKLWQKKKESDNALEEVVVGVEDSKKNGGNLKAAFNATESLVTRRKVAKILNGT